jgi:hypothetical protein
VLLFTNTDGCGVCSTVASQLIVLSTATAPALAASVLVEAVRGRLTDAAAGCQVLLVQGADCTSSRRCCCCCWPQGPYMLLFSMIGVSMGPLARLPKRALRARPAAMF